MKSRKNNKSIYDFLYNSQPNFFSDIFTLIINGINYILFLYIIFSFIIYLFFHFFALNIEISGFDVKTFLTYDSILFKNNFNNIILVCIIILGMFSTIKQNYFYFSIYLLSYGLFIFSFAFKINFTLIPIYSIIYKIFNIILLSGFLILLIYSLLYYFKIFKYVKYNINVISIEKLINEVKLKIDLAKMNYNAFMIKLGLHKISKKLLYTKKDYYFMNSDKENDNEKIKREFVKELDNYSRNNSDANTYASSIENNYINLDNENEPLKH